MGWLEAAAVRLAAAPVRLVAAPWGASWVRYAGGVRAGADAGCRPAAHHVAP